MKAGIGVASECSGVLEVRPSSGLNGTIVPPGDKSISHRALMLACLAEGSSTIQGLSSGDDVLRTKAAITSLGAGVVGSEDGAGLVVSGTGGVLAEPSNPMDMGNSGTGMRLMIGMVAPREGLFVFTGDSSLSSRPMDRVLKPLAEMGAVVDGRSNGSLAPIVVRGSKLSGIDYFPPVSSAQVKSALLLAGLGAAGPTTIRESHPTRPHTEELFGLCGIEVSSERFGEESGVAVTVRPGRPAGFNLKVPGDPSQAAFWVVAGLIVPGSEIVVENVYLGPTRSGFVNVLKRMGGDVEVDWVNEASMTANLRVRSSALTSTIVRAEEIPSLDEVPVLAVAASVANGETLFKDLAELRVKESDRLATVCSELSSLGVGIRSSGDDMVVTGGKIKGGACRSHGDHRIAMACAIAGLAAGEPTRISGWDSVATSYPQFNAHLEAVGADFRSETGE